MLSALKGEGLDARLRQAARAAASAPRWCSQERRPRCHGAAVEPAPSGAQARARRSRRACCRRRKNAQGETETRRCCPSRRARGRSRQPLTPAAGWRVNPRLLGLLEKKGVRTGGRRALPAAARLRGPPRDEEDRPAARRASGAPSSPRCAAADEIARRGGKRMFRAVLARRLGSIAATYFQTGPWLKARFPVGKRLVVSGEAAPVALGLGDGPPRDRARRRRRRTRRFTSTASCPSTRASSATSSARCGSWPTRSSSSYAARRRGAAARRAAGAAPAVAAGRGGAAASTSRRATRRLDAARRRTSSRAHQRLAFDELFFLQLGMALKRPGGQGAAGHRLRRLARAARRARARCCPSPSPAPRSGWWRSWPATWRGPSR